MTIDAPMPPEDHKALVTEVTDSDHPFYELTCTCGLSRNIEATPATSGKPSHWADNARLRHLYIVGTIDLDPNRKK